MTHNPGSPAAIADGCTCSPERNLGGNGEPNGVGHTYYVDSECPMHGGAVARRTRKKEMN